MFNTIIEMASKVQDLITWTWFEDANILFIEVNEFTEEEFCEVVMHDNRLMSFLDYIRANAEEITYRLYETCYFDSFIVQIEV